MKISEWIDPALHRDFVAEQTDAIRLCTCPDGWVERFGVDVLISHKNDAALRAAQDGALSLGAQCRFPIQAGLRALSPEKKCGARSAAPHPGRSGDESGKHRAGADVALRDRFRGRIFRRAFHRSTRKPPLRPGGRAAEACSTASPTPARFPWRRPRSEPRRSASIFRKNRSPAAGKILRSIRLPTNDHRFLADDVMEVLPRLARKGEKFDVIILDPPTFSRSHRGKGVSGRAGFRDVAPGGAGGGGAGRQNPAFDELLEPGGTRARSHGAVLPQGDAARGTFHREAPLPDFPPGVGAATRLAHVALTNFGHAKDRRDAKFK